jgi:hypothetical protein
MAKKRVDLRPTSFPRGLLQIRFSLQQQLTNSQKNSQLESHIADATKRHDVAPN